MLDGIQHAKALDPLAAKQVRKITGHGGLEFYTTPEKYSKVRSRRIESD
jgi:hypothetical protein